MLNFIICDDNFDILDKFSHMFESVFMKNNLEAHVGFKTTSSSKLLSYIKENHVDVLILDINLHDNLTGLQIAEIIREQNNDCYIIFTTAHCEYVFLAYRYKVFDYICKPITQERLEETVLRLFKDIKRYSIGKNYIKIDNKNTIINESEIQYIKRDGMKLIFHTKSGDYETYSSFNKIEPMLPNNFVRCHKSFIANISNITKFEPMANKIYFSCNEKCDVGPKYKNTFMEVIKYYGDTK